MAVKGYPVLHAGKEISCTLMWVGKSISEISNLA